MKHFVSLPGDAGKTASIDALVHEFGAWRVLFRSLRAVLLAPRPDRSPGLDLMDDRMRRDIGLPPQRPAPVDWRDLR